MVCPRRAGARWLQLPGQTFWGYSPGPLIRATLFKKGYPCALIREREREREREGRREEEREREREREREGNGNRKII